MCMKGRKVIGVDRFFEPVLDQPFILPGGSCACGQKERSAKSATAVEPAIYAEVPVLEQNQIGRKLRKKQADVAAARFHCGLDRIGITEPAVVGCL